MDISKIRTDYTKAALSEKDVLANPFKQFSKWFDEALHAQVPEPNAMSIASVSSEGKPSNRIVLLKGFDEEGFVFYTNYTSRKGPEIIANPNVSLLFFWPELERQVRIEGKALKVSTEESEHYFYSRPQGSQIGAIASHQSSILRNREDLENKVIELTKLYENQSIPFPDFWGGFKVFPSAVEFWQGRHSRLHDRIKYLTEGALWKIVRLSP